MEEHAARSLLAFAENAGRGLRGLNASPWRDRLQRRFQDLEAAFDWLLDHGQAGDALALASALADLLRSTGRVAIGRRWLDRALEAATIDGRLKAVALYENGLLVSGRAPTTKRAACMGGAWTSHAGWATAPRSLWPCAGWPGLPCARTWTGRGHCARRRSRRCRTPTTRSDARTRCTSSVSPRRCEATYGRHATS
jgi:hypothetical protein